MLPDTRIFLRPAVLCGPVEQGIACFPLKHLFEDRTKFRILKEDPTNTRFTSIQNFLRILKKRGEINEEEFKTMFPDDAKIGGHTEQQRFTRISPEFLLFDRLWTPLAPHTTELENS